jgi:asparagine synthase (glutamine-hydrolysing)
MCGISGAVRLDETGSIDPAPLAAMRDTMVHRGPDSAGMLVCDTADLAMRRLAIIDVVAGQQPLTSEDGQVHVVCNGEIYNYRELRPRLERAGHTFRTGSDCEVVVHAYEEYGDEFLSHLNGMFALAVWDDRRRRLVLARDRVGIKPLFYASHVGLLLFASEPKALLAYPGFPRVLDLVALDQYLTYHYVPTPRSMFAGVSKVRPGHALIVQNGNVSEKPYWQLDLSPAGPAARASEAELSERLWQTLRQSVQLELVSDVPLGVFLSGGIDSSAVVAAMADLGVRDIRTFSIGFQEPSFDESAHARCVAAHIGTSHSELVVEPHMLWELVPDIAGVLDEPLADASVIPTHLLSRFTRRQVTVALGGDGGDELFAGYSTLQAHRLATYYNRIPGFLRERAIAPAVRRLPVSHRNLSLDFRAKRFVQAADLPLPIRHHLWMAPCTARERRELLRPDVLHALGDRDALDALHEHVERSHTYDEVSKVLYLDMKMYLESDILAKVDRASMACSLEVRVPLLNRLMLDFASHVPSEFKLRGLTRKYLLRKALTGRLPQRIIDRPKKGFGLPVSSWLCTDLRELMLDTLSEQHLSRQGIFDPESVTRSIREHLAKQRDNRMILWALLIFQLWYDRYLAPGSPAVTTELRVGSGSA